MFPPAPVFWVFCKKLFKIIIDTYQKKNYFILVNFHSEINILKVAKPFLKSPETLFIYMK